MGQIDFRILTDTDEQLEKVKNKLITILLEDDNVYDFFIQDEIRSCE